MNIQNAQCNTRLETLEGVRHDTINKLTAMLIKHEVLNTDVGSVSNCRFSAIVTPQPSFEKIAL